MKRFRIAILGTGGIARAHAQAVKDQGDRAELVAAMDLDPARAKAFCEQHGIAECFTDADELLRKSRPDLVTIATPPGVHCGLVVKALEGGAWAFCEKPLVGSLAVVLEAMERGERPPVSGPESRRIVEFISCLYKSAATGHPVRRGTLPAADPFYQRIYGNLAEVAQLA